MHHKTMAKQPAKLTQRRAQTFEIQVANRQIDSLVIDRSVTVMEAQSMQLAPSMNQRKVLTSSTPSHHSVIYKGGGYTYSQQELWQTTSSSRKRKKAAWFDFQQQGHVTAFLQQLEERLGGPQTFQLFTECKRHEIIFRANPKYKDGQWQDWAFIDWGAGNGTIPAHLMIFIDLTNIKTMVEINGTTVDTPGMYAIIHSLSTQLNIDDDAAYYTSCLVNKRVKQMNEGTNIPTLMLVNCEAIHSPCIALPYAVKREISSDHTYLFLKGRLEWKQILLEHLLQQPGVPRQKGS
jgi:hypothetical protein